MTSNLNIRIVLLLLAFSLLLINTEPAGSADRFTIVYFDDYRPFSWCDENDRMRGLLVDIITEAIEKRMSSVDKAAIVGSK